MKIHGLAAAEGETAFAFCVLRLRQPTARTALLDLVRFMAPLIPDAETVMEDLLPEDLEQAVRIIAVPWQPGDPGAQRAVIEAAHDHGVEEVWFFQTGTSLPPVDQDDDDANDDDIGWSHGTPPQVDRTRFPIDAIADADTEDFGIAIKLAGEILPGEGTVLLAFHTLWLAPYGGRYRNSAVTIDRKRHAAHLWVDRFEVLADDEDLIGHLLWIVSKLDEVVPVVHARFAPATMAQKYGELLGEEDEEPFVLGGNPLMARYALGGEEAVDEWIGEQTAWSKEEVAQMLREVAVEIVTAGEGQDEHDGAAEDDDFDDDGGADAADDARVAYSHDEHDDVDYEHDHDAHNTHVQRRHGKHSAQSAQGHDNHDHAAHRHDDADDHDDARVAHSHDDLRDHDDQHDDDGDYEHDHDAHDGHDHDDADLDRGQAIAMFAADILHERAKRGLLDPRATRHLLPVLTARNDDRRRDAIAILGAARARAAVPALVNILRTDDDLAAAAATALGHIGDPSAVIALAEPLLQRGSSPTSERAAIADALVACLSPGPFEHSTAILDALLTTAANPDEELSPTLLFAIARLAVCSATAAAQNSVRERLAALDLDDPTLLLARQAALVMLGEKPSRDFAALLHESLTLLDYDHETTVRRLRVALQVADLVPSIVDAADLAWLTSFVEIDIRTAAHAVLSKLGKPLPAARAFERYSVRDLDDDEVIEHIGEARVVGRGALIGEAARRRLVRAVPAIIDACHDVVSRARHGAENLLDPDTRVLEAAVPFLRRQQLDDQIIALFDRILRYPNYHVKAEFLHDPPTDARLVGGMVHVLGEKWSWQEEAAREWLASVQGEPPRPPAAPPAAPRDDAADEDETNADDQDMN